MNFSEDDQFNDAPENLEDMKKGINFLIDELDIEKDPIKKASIQSLLGVYNRLIESNEEAVFYLEKAAEQYIAAEKMALCMLTQIRLARAYFRSNQISKSEKTLNDCLKEALVSKNKNIKSLVDKIYINLGKMKFVQKQYSSSLELFLKAMDVSLSNGDLDKIENAKKIIEVVRIKLDEKNKS